MGDISNTLSTVLAIGAKPVLKPNDPPQAVAEHLEVEKFMSPPYLLPDNHFTEIYAQFVLNRLMDPRPALAELFRIARKDCLLEVTVPHGASDAAWEDPRFVRPYFPNSFLQFSRPVLKTGEAYDWQAKAVYIRVPDGLLAQIPEEQRFQGTMIQRNIGQEICCVLQAIKPMRKADDPDKIRLPKILVQPFSARNE